jgi:hypothetical protein
MQLQMPAAYCQAHDKMLHFAQAKGNADTTHLITQDAVGLVTPVVHHPLQTQLLPTSQQLH